jgi:hypothetical protein
MENLNEKEKRDRCLRIADRKFDKPSAYKSGAVVRCRKGDIWKDLKETTLSSLTSIEPYNDPNDEYAQDLDFYLEDDNIDWREESYITLLNPNNIEPSEWNYLSDDPNNKKSISISKEDPRTIPPILVVKKGENKYEVIDGIHRVYAFRLNNYKIPAIVMTPKLEQGLSTSDYQMVNFMFNKYQNSSVPSPTKIVDLKEVIKKIIQEDESLHKWFNRRGGNGEKGWVDCNTCREVDGKTKCKPCGRKKGEERAKYPSCRPTPAGCKDKGKGKTWGKTKENMIKLKDLILELDSEKIFHIEGIIIIDNQKRNIQDILSDIRALAGITIVRNIDIEQDITSRYYKSKLEIKIDPYPYIKQNKFDSNSTLELISNNIKAVPGVIGFKKTADPYSTDN